nr:N-acetylneuraminate synthase [Hydrogenispora ethanolica]
MIAEAGVNHNGDLDLAVALLEEAARAGADAVKFQAFIPEEMILQGTGKARYQRGVGDDEDQYQMLKRLQMSQKNLKLLLQKANELGIFFLASVFDEQSADELQAIAAQAFKIPSGEITNLPLIRKVAAYGKPLIISTGMALLGEIEEAVHAVFQTGNRQLMLLHCVSSYPAPYDSLNLSVIKSLQAAFQVPVGYSDHAEGIEAAVVAVALGAKLLEKHFTLDKNLPGPDHQASLNPGEFRQYVTSIRKVETALGNGCKNIVEAEKEVRILTRKSIVATTQIERHMVITRDMIALKRPGTGVPPKYLDYFIGARASHRILENTQLLWSDLEWNCE